TVPLPPTRRRFGMSYKRAGADILPPCQGTRTSSTPSDTPTWRPTASRTFGRINSDQPHVLGWSGALEAFWTGVIAIVIWLGKRQVGKALRLAPRTRFAHRIRNSFDHLGIGASFPRREHPLDHLDCGLDLLIRHRLNAALVLDLHFFRHQHCADLQIRGRRFASNPLEHLAPMLLPILRQIEQKALVERSARSLRGAARVIQESPLPGVASAAAHPGYANLARSRGTCRVKARCVGGVQSSSESGECIPRKRRCIVEGWVPGLPANHNAQPPL